MGERSLRPPVRPNQGASVSSDVAKMLTRNTFKPGLWERFTRGCSLLLNATHPGFHQAVWCFQMHLERTTDMPSFSNNDEIKNWCLPAPPNGFYWVYSEYLQYLSSCERWFGGDGTEITCWSPISCRIREEANSDWSGIPIKTMHRQEESTGLLLLFNLVLTLLKNTQWRTL